MILSSSESSQQLPECVRSCLLSVSWLGPKGTSDCSLTRVGVLEGGPVALTLASGAAMCLFVLTLYRCDKDKIPWDLGRWCQSEESLPQDVSQAVRFLVPLTLSGQAKNKFTACGARRRPTGWMLAKMIERERDCRNQLKPMVRFITAPEQATEISWHYRLFYIHHNIQI